VTDREIRFLDFTILISQCSSYSFVEILMIWVPDSWQPLPTNEWLLMVADHCHNKTGNRGYGTFAIGAVGKNALKVKLVVGVNSSAYDETNLTAEDNVPPVVRNALELAGCVMTKEPYHAEVSCALWAKANSMELIAVASSRKVCPICTGFLARNAPTARVVDGWQRTDNSYLTQQQRAGVNFGSAWVDQMGASSTKAVRMP
jgi:hypothetical protein